MSEPSSKPIPYKVAYSERVRAATRGLLTRAAAYGVGPLFLSAVKEIDARLHIYPQFGEPLRDLKTAGETEYVATVPPLVVRYIIDEDKRVVFVGVPFRPFHGSGV